MTALRYVRGAAMASLLIPPPEDPVRAASQWLGEAEAWRLTYADPQATVHVRVGSPDCAIPAAPVTRRFPPGQPSTRG